MYTHRTDQAARFQNLKIASVIASPMPSDDWFPQVLTFVEKYFLMLWILHTLLIHVLDHAKTVDEVV